MMTEHERYTKKMLRKIKAHYKGKSTKVTYPNPDERATNRKWITTTGLAYWGDPKAKIPPLKDNSKSPKG